MQRHRLFLDKFASAFETNHQGDLLDSSKHVQRAADFYNDFLDIIRAQTPDAPAITVLGHESRRQRNDILYRIYSRTMVAESVVRDCLNQ